jgi:hypothetical protein
MIIVIFVLKRTEKPSQHIFSSNTKNILARFRTDNISKIRKKLRDIDFSKFLKIILILLSILNILKNF